MPAKPNKPAPEVKSPAKAIVPPADAEKKVEPPIVPKGALPTPAPQPEAKLAKDLGAEKFLAKCLTTIKGVSQEDISKAVNESWAKIATWKLQTAFATIKAKFAPGGFNPVGALIVGSSDNVDKERVNHGGLVYALKDKRFTNLKLDNESVLNYEQLSSGREFTKVSVQKWVLDPKTAESVVKSDAYNYSAHLAAAIPKDDVPKHVFVAYEIVCFECKVTNFGDEYTNPMATKNGELKFSLSPLAVTDWDVAGWIHNRVNGVVFISALGEGELAEYSKMDANAKAAFLDSIFRDQIVMVCGKVGKSIWNEYKGNKSLDLDTIGIHLRPDDLDPVVYESRPMRQKQPANGAIEDTPVNPDDEPAEQDNRSPDEILGNVPVTENQPEQKPADELTALTAQVAAISKRTADEVQQSAIRTQSEYALGGKKITLVEALKVLLAKYQAPAQKPSLKPPAKAIDYKNPADDSPALAEVRATALRNGWDFGYEDLMEIKSSLKNVNEQSLSKEVFAAFMSANK